LTHEVEDDGEEITARDGRGWKGREGCELEKEGRRVREVKRTRRGSRNRRLRCTFPRRATA